MPLDLPCNLRGMISVSVTLRPWKEWQKHDLLKEIEITRRALREFSEHLGKTIPNVAVEVRLQIGELSPELVTRLRQLHRVD